MEKENGINVMASSFLLTDAIISPLGFNTSENLKQIKAERSGLHQHFKSGFFPDGFYGGLMEKNKINDHFLELGNPDRFTKLEKMMILAIEKVINLNPNLNIKNTGLVISTTKGNIDLLKTKKFEANRKFLWKMAQVIAEFFNIKSAPIVISNACISGALAIKVANNFIETGKFQNAIVVAGDIASDFILSGFQSFHAISDKPCKPFSKDRNGISPGEAAAAMLIGPIDKKTEAVQYMDSVTANDANHISGPSRTGEGLYQSIEKLLIRNNLKGKDINYLSAHGTATIFNDEMEAIAFERAGINQVPVNSFKGYYGHTLGASALIETILTKHTLLNNELYTSLNYSEHGVTKPLNVIKKPEKRELKLALKTASGFGGCNLAMLLKKV